MSRLRLKARSYTVICAARPIAGAVLRCTGSATDEALAVAGAEKILRRVREMQSMLEDYLAFAKGDGGEISKLTNLRELGSYWLKDLPEQVLLVGADMGRRVTNAVAMGQGDLTGNRQAAELER